MMRALCARKFLQAGQIGLTGDGCLACNSQILSSGPSRTSGQRENVYLSRLRERIKRTFSFKRQKIDRVSGQFSNKTIARFGPEPMISVCAGSTGIHGFIAVFTQEWNDFKALPFPKIVFEIPFPIAYHLNEFRQEVCP